MEDTNCPYHGSPTPTNTLHPVPQTTDSDQELEPYTFSQELSYTSSEDDVTDEVTSHALTPTPPFKRPKPSNHHHHHNPDLISTFPDSILCHMLSLLPAEHCVATALLSKRWRHLWTAVPTLLFRLWSFRHGLDEFVSFVSQTFFLYSNADIKKFRLDFDCALHYQSRVYGWIHFALRHKVEDLKLDLYKLYADDRYPFVRFYKLPEFIYRYGLLKKLSISYCANSPRRSIKWKLLRTLSISYAELSDDLVGVILLGSPVLESLELYKCSGIIDLSIKSASLRKLVVNDNWGARFGVLEISGQNLQSLRILGFFHEKRCRVRNVSGLIDVILNFQLSTDSEEYQDMLREILENHHHVKKLTIRQWCIQVLSICEMRGLPSSVSSCNHLTLDTCLNIWDFPGIVSLLRCSPDLETLVIKITPPRSTKFKFDSKSSWDYYAFVSKYLDSKNMCFENSLPSLQGRGRSI